MVQFEISAPGKVILHGEHAVVYGKTALAASLNLRTKLQFRELDSNVIQIECPDVHMSLSIPLDVFLEYFQPSYPFNENTDRLLDQVEHFVTLKKDFSDTYSGARQQKLSLQALLYLLVYIAYEEQIQIKSFSIRLYTELTVGAGLGSSASFAVCLAACFLHWARLLKGDVHDTFDEDDLEKISKYALNCERIMHGSPSGIDNSVCTYGGMIEFRRGEPVNVLPNMPSMKILLVNTEVSRNTKDLVERVTRLREIYPAVIDSIFDSIDAVSRTALQVLGEIHDAQTTNDAALLDSRYKKLFSLIHMNQGLLSTLDVSHSKLDIICSVARNYSFAGKLTGAGGGGYAYILLLPDTESELITHLSELLEKERFSVRTTSLGCNGVTIERSVKIQD
ncbi:mevalonate kinase-like protein [Lasius niger]|uniref:Mevalonate kinase n=1 Tax=Lasius niger TaxID=67767 RepID=A0A0J7L7Q1_LASNI|nr:mevalonate kinase-like protein [Lasius niger]